MAELAIITSEPIAAADVIGTAAPAPAAPEVAALRAAEPLVSRAGFIESLRLVEDGRPDLVLLPSPELSPYRVKRFDPGWPNPRPVTSNRPNADGQTDNTRWHGAKAVSMTVTVIATPETSVAQARRTLMAWTHPAARPRLRYRAVDEPEMEIRLRGDQAGGLFEHGRGWSMECQIGWAAPDGVDLSADPFELWIDPEAATAQGRTYPRAYPRFYPPSKPSLVDFQVQGTAPTWPVVDIFGPCTGPRFSVTGAVVEFDATFVVADGQYVRVDPRNKTAQLDGLPGRDNSVRHRITRRQWWSLSPGWSKLRFYPVTAAGASRARVAGQFAWL